MEHTHGIDDLPALSLSAFQGNPSSSPPPGHNRLSSKRNLSPDIPEKESTRSIRQRIENLPGSEVNLLHPAALANSKDDMVQGAMPTVKLTGDQSIVGEVLDLSSVTPSPKIANDLN